MGRGNTLTRSAITARLLMPMDYSWTALLVQTHYVPTARLEETRNGLCSRATLFTPRTQFIKNAPLVPKVSTSSQRALSLLTLSAQHAQTRPTLNFSVIPISRVVSSTAKRKQVPRALCCLHKKDMNCGTLTTRERDGKRNGFVAGEDFIAFCEDLCEEFPDCMAFEVKKELGNKPTCYFKSSYTQNNKQQWTGADDKWDCYSNTCRQNSYVGRPAINYSPDAGDAKRKSPIMGGRRR